jgi:integrase
MLMTEILKAAVGTTWVKREETDMNRIKGLTRDDVDAEGRPTFEELVEMAKPRYLHFDEEYPHWACDGLSNVSINNELRVLRRILNYAKEQGVPGVSGDRVKQVSQSESGRVKVWSAEEVDSLFAACAKESPAILGLVAFLANTGCRRGEALALTWDRVDLEKGMIEIWPSEFWQPKSGRPREIPISDSLLPWLRGPRQSERWVFPTKRTKKGKGGDRYVDWPSRAFDRARTAAGLKGGPHTLRHTYASHFLTQQSDLFLLAQVLGHSNTSTTKLYSHLLPGHLARARNAVSFAPKVGPAALAAAARWKAEAPKTLRKNLRSGAAG